MGLKEHSEKRKTMAVILLTSVAVLVLTVTAFTAYDLATYRRNLTSSLSASAAIIADRSLAAVALRDEKDARASLAARRAAPRMDAGGARASVRGSAHSDAREARASLRADPRIAAAALYD